MRKTLYAAMALIATICNASAQNFSAADVAKMNENNLVPGKIVTLKGDTLTGFLKKMNEPSTTFEGFGVRVKFVSANDFNANEKLSNKVFSSYNAKEIKGYIYDYTNTNRSFLSAKIKSVNLQGFVELGTRLPDGEYQCTIYTDPASKAYPATTTHQGLLTAKAEALMITEQNPTELYKTRCPEIAKKWTENYYSNNNVGKVLTYDKVRLTAFNDYVKTCGTTQK